MSARLPGYTQHETTSATVANSNVKKYIHFDLQVDSSVFYDVIC